MKKRNKGGDFGFNMKASLNSTTVLHHPRHPIPKKPT